MHCRSTSASRHVLGESVSQYHTRTPLNSPLNNSFLKMFPISYKDPFFTLRFTYIQSLFARACVLKCLALLLILIQKMVLWEAKCIILYSWLVTNFWSIFWSYLLCLVLYKSSELVWKANFVLLLVQNSKLVSFNFFFFFFFSMHASVVSCYHNFREKNERAGVMISVWICHPSCFLISLGYGELWRAL